MNKRIAELEAECEEWKARYSQWSDVDSQLLSWQARCLTAEADNAKLRLLLARTKLRLRLARHRSYW